MGSDPPYQLRPARPKYLPPDFRYDDEIVKEYKPHDKPSDEEYAVYTKQCFRMAEACDITKPKGYKVSIHFNPQMEEHHFGQTHPMKPWRLTLSKSLITSYGMNFAMDNYLARAATREEMEDFHDEDYLEFLSRVMPEAQPRDIDNPGSELKYNLGGSDCPLFEGLWEYCSLSAGGALDAARKICTGQSQIAISWGGGLHHAKKSDASGFCYINDIVLAILQLLRWYARVLYIDIDVHHGDGVEEAFFSTDRVMTCSFHKYDPNNFFPGTGALTDNGPKNENNPGVHHSINVPLQDGITDEQYATLFENIIGNIMAKYRPEAIVLQCGADSLAGDRIGKFNLQVQGHAHCVEFMKKFNVPLILLGGGGYTPRNVARAWAYETAVAIGAQANLKAKIPQHTPYRKHFRQEALLPSLREILGDVSRPNKNSAKRIAEIQQHIAEQLRFINAAPSVQLQDIPGDLQGIRDETEQRIRDDQEDARVRREHVNSEIARRKLEEEAVGMAGER